MPMSNIRRPAPGSGRNRRLTPEEQTRLLQAVDKHSNPMFGWVVRIAVQTGMRLSEIATLRIRQVDIERRVVRLDHTKNSSSRTVPLTAEATRVFTEALANPLRTAETELVFFGEPGRDGNDAPTCSTKHGPMPSEQRALKSSAFTTCDTRLSAGSWKPFERSGGVGHQRSQVDSDAQALYAPAGRRPGAEAGPPRASRAAHF